MVTLSDMLLLLLTFFVLLISMSSFDQTMLIRTFGASSPGNSGVLQRGDSLPLVTNREKPEAERSRPRDLIYYRRLSAPLSQLLDGLERDLGKSLLRAEVVDRDLELEIAGDRLFGTLDDNLKLEGRLVLARLCEFMRSWSGIIEIEVYTDNFPINTRRFPDSQVLAARRGERLVKTLAVLGLPSSRIVLAAYGSDRACVANDTPEHRRRNRRIVFRLPRWATSRSETARL